MYSKLPAFVLGFHGCDRSVKRKILNSKDTLKHSNNEYDWLGHGIYFWENDPYRALDYASYIKDNPERCKVRINNPDVIGAIIDLGYCLNLFEQENLRLVKEAYVTFRGMMKIQGLPLPQNMLGNDLLKRYLDCAVINSLVNNRKDDAIKNPSLCLNTFDSIRAPFWEGKKLYPKAGFKEKNHIQICVLNDKCIKGYFDPIMNKNEKFEFIES